MAGSVQSRHVEGFRTLRFSSLADVKREADRIAEAERAGRLVRRGNWTAGQTFNHIATWINFALDGYPKQLRPPWLIKVLMRMQKKRFLRGPMPRGVRIPGVEGGTLGTEDVPLEEGLAKLHAALDRLERTPPQGPNPVFGMMTHEEWKTANIRHAELHLGYLDPGD